MDQIKVMDMMVPLADYATVNQEASLYDAVLALQEAQAKFETCEYKHRAVLVLDDDGNVVGKLSQNDIIRGLEPGYQKIGDGMLTHYGLNREFILSMMSSHNLWSGKLDNICNSASSIKVKDIMYTPADGEYVDSNATLDEAVHQLVIGHHQSLLVTSKGKAIGVLRLTDVFSEIASAVLACKKET